MTQQVIDTDVLRRSVTREEVQQSKQTYMWLGSWMIPQPLITLPPEPPAYWSHARDDVLLSTQHAEDKWTNAVAIAATKCASKEYDIESEVPLRMNRSHDILSAVDGMQGWSPFIVKHMQDFLCTDNGAFVEIVRSSKSIGSRIVGLLHLDSRRCFRTGDPEIPVIYRDRLGAIHELRAHQVIAICDMPTPRLTFNGVGLCAASRAYRTIYRMAVIETYIAEKVSGRKPLAVHLLSGMSPKQLQEVFQAAQGQADAKGLTTYMGAAATAVPTDGDISIVTIPFSELPDGFDLEKERSNARLEYANTIGLDIQDLQPGAIGGSLGSSTQSQVLNEKAKGKGLAYWSKTFSEQLNLKVLPDATTHIFVEKDFRADTDEANAANARQTSRAGMISASMITPEQGLQMAVDAGDAPREFLSADATPGGAISSAEKPVDEEAQTGTDVQEVEKPEAEQQGPPATATKAFADAFKGYSPTQKRAPKGADNGGQWVKEGEGEDLYDEGEDNGDETNEAEAEELTDHEWLESVTYDEKEAITYYTGSAYGPVNKVLRGKSDPVEFYTDVEGITKSLDSALDRAIVAEDMTVYRGVRTDVFNDDATQFIGKTFVDKGYVSTTAVSKDAFKVGYVMKINVPQGAKGAYLDGLSGFPEEDEVLLPRGSKFKIKAVNGDTIQADLIP